MKRISVTDVQKLHPNFVQCEEMYHIFTKSQVLTLQLYINSDFGLEYTFWDSDHYDIDGGVIDNFDIEMDEGVQAAFITGFLEDSLIRCSKIKKLSEAEMFDFEMKTRKALMLRVSSVKNTLSKKEL